MTKYHRFDSSEYDNDSDYENVRESDYSGYENVKDPSEKYSEIKEYVKDSDDNETESQDLKTDVFDDEQDSKFSIIQSDDDDCVTKDLELDEETDCQCCKNKNAWVNTKSSEGASSTDSCDSEVKGINSQFVSCDNLYWYEGNGGAVDSNKSPVTIDTSDSFWDDLDTP